MATHMLQGREDTRTGDNSPPQKQQQQQQQKSTRSGEAWHFPFPPTPRNALWSRGQKNGRAHRHMDTFVVERICCHQRVERPPPPQYGIKDGLRGPRAVAWGSLQEVVLCVCVCCCHSIFFGEFLQLCMCMCVTWVSLRTLRKASRTRTCVNGGSAKAGTCAGRGCFNSANDHTHIQSWLQ